MSGTIVVILIVVWVCARHQRRNAGTVLARKFARLGNLVGRTQIGIIAEVGQPNSITYLPGYSLLQWYAPGYRVGLKFAEGQFAGVAHESAQ